MNGDTAQDEEKPLDPEMEKVRKKLVKFSSVFMGLNMVAIMAVLGAVLYKIGVFGDDSEDAASSSITAVVPVEPGFEKVIDLPDGTRVLSASEQNGRVMLNLRFSDGASAIWFYDIASGQISGKLSIQ